jgi:photosystem II stability/assembly factor-like uncharacterized protein
MIICYIIFVIVTFAEVHAEWTQQTNGLPASFYSMAAIDACSPLNAIITTAPHAIYKTSNAGEIWSLILIPEVDSLFNIVDVSMPDPNHIWVVNSVNPSIRASSDGGLTWNTQYYSESTANDTSLITSFNYIEMFDSLNGIAMGDGSYVLGRPAVFLATNNGGQIWSPHQQDGMPTGSYHLWKSVDFVSPEIGYFYKNKGSAFDIWKTSNGCDTWSFVTIDEPATFPGIKFYDANRGIVVGSFNMWSTDNAGDTWSKTIINEFNANDYNWVSDIEFMPNNSNSFWMSVENNLLYTSDNGASFDTLLSTTLGEFIDIVFTDSLNAWALSSVGLYHTSNGGILSYDSKQNIVSNFVLEQNYPNPFNPTTTINYLISTKMDVKIIVYNILGEQIKTLVKEEKEPGYYSVMFDATKLSSGTYFYKITSNNFTEVRKMILLK